ncbi:FAD-dependent oxidoreductase [Alpinimonas psychrophila]|uniref:Thioredoxin reductase (NADPH) n=1 Tax=Alpinimonas psychrophila TaxID=748908 RepID=A0A7W3PQ01_9MICO|nr:thioredoxin reductase (NADPH) [Alpinimonas psychrophila]
MTNQEHHDVIIIGAGAAGLSAGLVLARAQANVLLIDAGNPRNGGAAEMHGFVSRDGLSPTEFLAIARNEVIGYGATVLCASVRSIEREINGCFTVTLSTGLVTSARALLIATGLTDKLPAIAGVQDRWSTLVHYCPYCHGFEVLDKAIVVIGGPVREMSIKQAGLLRKYSDRVTFVTHGIELTDSERHRLEAFGVSVVDGAISRLVGHTGEIDGVALAGGTIIACEAVFIAPPQRPNDELLRDLGCAVDPDSDFITVNQMGQTTVPGVWAAGNVVTPTAQVITAAGAGSASAIAINGWLLNKDLDDASAHVAHS